MMMCPYCQLETGQVKVGRTEANSQRWMCQNCKRKYTPRPKPKGYPPHVRLRAQKMYDEGMGYREIARALQVNHQTVINWLKGAKSSAASEEDAQLEAFEALLPLQ